MGIMHSISTNKSIEHSFHSTPAKRCPYACAWRTHTHKHTTSDFYIHKPHSHTNTLTIFPSFYVSSTIGLVHCALKIARNPTKWNTSMLWWWWCTVKMNDIHPKKLYDFRYRTNTIIRAPAHSECMRQDDGCAKFRQLCGRWQRKWHLFSNDEERVVQSGEHEAWSVIQRTVCEAERV